MWRCPQCGRDVLTRPHASNCPRRAGSTPLKGEYDVSLPRLHRLNADERSERC